MESKLEKLETLKIPKTDEERKDQDEEELCKSIMNGLARRSREKHSILANVGEKRTTRHMHR